MYIYQLPFEINKELCRLMDNDDLWKDLAGRMNYSAFDVTEIDQIARRQATSPTSLLFIRWGQLNHRAEELFMLLYRMKHVPAMRCLIPVIDVKFQRLLNKQDSCNMGQRDTIPVEDNVKRHKAVTKSSESIPLPVMLIEKKGHMQEVQLISLPGSNTNGYSPIDESSSDMSKNTSTASRTDKLNDELLKNVNAIPMLSYNDLLEATNNWAESNLLGRGGFGQVFKGEWKLLPVAVKRLLGHDESNKELIRELCLNQYRHDNILPLYGYSIGGPETCLVYQLMLGESLDRRLKSKTQPLTWCQRYRVAHGVARGLAYLHTMAGAPLIHGDIKPANILLDACTAPKIGDFGLARKGPFGGDRAHLKVSKYVAAVPEPGEPQWQRPASGLPDEYDLEAEPYARPIIRVRQSPLRLRVHGTGAYLPEEYLVSRCLSPAVDVFSFGVVLLEVGTALPPAERARRPPLLSHYLRDQARQQVDLALFEDRMLINTPLSSPELCRRFIQMGLECTRRSWTERPTMLEVYKTLDALDVPGKNDF